MHRRILSLAFIGFISISIFNWGCTKLDTTNLGSDLIPAVDNVNTFADTFHVDAIQNNYGDTTYVSYAADHILGNINNDPLFGKTTANIYFQLKPTIFPFSFGNKDSIIGLDSVVLCLLYKGFYGDTNVVQQLQATEVIDDSFRISSGKIWRTDEQPLTGAIISQPATVNVDVRTLGNYMKYTNGRDSVHNQIRIKLDAGYAASLFNSSSDSFSVGTGNHALYNDSIYKRTFSGIAVKSIGIGAGLIYTNLADTNTKLEIHYRIKNGGHIDTTYISFPLETAGNPYITTSKTANYITRDRSGTPSASPNPTELYLQTQPGTYATLTIPQLTGYSNRIIHRAELIIEQIPYNIITDSIYKAPNYLYLDLKDSGTAVPTRYKPVYLDLNINEYYNPDNSVGFYPSVIDFGYFGGILRTKTGPLGTSMGYYNINISRYIQQLVKNQGTNYQFRLFPAYSIHYGQYSAYEDYNNGIAYGRVKVGSGSNPTYPMRLRIIYSKIK